MRPPRQDQAKTQDSFLLPLDKTISPNILFLVGNLSLTVLLLLSPVNCNTISLIDPGRRPV